MIFSSCLREFFQREREREREKDRNKRKKRARERDRKKDNIYIRVRIQRNTLIYNILYIFSEAICMFKERKKERKQSQFGV